MVPERQNSMQFLGPHQERYGVIDVALSIQDSIVLIVGPPSCMREPYFDAYFHDNADRLFSYVLTENDLIFGDYSDTILKVLITLGKERKPGVIFLCTVCSDEITGTICDWVTEEAESALQIPVRRIRRIPICKKHAPSPEQKKYAIYLTPCSFSEHNTRSDTSGIVQILGEFEKIPKINELHAWLSAHGLQVQSPELSSSTSKDLRRLLEASFNLVIHPRGLYMAKQLETDLGIPYYYIPPTYGFDLVRETYKTLENFLGNCDNSHAMPGAKPPLPVIDQLQGLKIALGSGISGSPFELACVLSDLGIEVTSIFVEQVTEFDQRYLSLLRETTSPVKIFVTTDPDVICSKIREIEAEYVIGPDAVRFCPGVRIINPPPNEACFGYQLLPSLLDLLIHDVNTRGKPERFT